MNTEADAMGMYSGDSTGFLRGYQMTSSHGTVNFDTIFPGHYTDRANHVHITVRPGGKKHYAHEGMIYFDDWVRKWIEVSARLDRFDSLSSVLEMC
jgi:protocatechuate 3,4-dioxygenase beta subunit